MSSIPVLKFEKSTNYLNSQLDIQLNNKQLASDIIANINLILAKKSANEKSSYLDIQNSANKFLQNFSENITIIEELKREINHITSDLTEVIEEVNRKEKSKEYYIAAISTVKNNIENYTSKFQYFEQKLNQDNINFNEFINKKNTNNSESSTNQKDIKINKLTNEFKTMLSNLSEDTVLSLDLISALKSEFSNPIADSSEKNTEFEKTSNIVEETSQTIEEAQIDNENPNIVIDYSSIYKNFYNKRASTIEENIFSEYSTFTPSSHLSNNDKKTNKTPLFILEDDEEDLEDNEDTTINDKLEENATNITDEPIIVVNDISSNEETVEIPSTEVKNEENNLAESNTEIAEETLDILDEELTEEISNELAKELLEKELFESTQETTTENIEITDEDLLNEILKEEISKESNVDDIILNNPSLTEELLKDSSITDEISILDSISDDDILEELLISDSTADDIILKDYNSADTKTSSEETINENLLNYCNIEEKIKDIQTATSNNDTLIISEKQNKIFLPYTVDELEKYLKTYPNVYISTKDVVEQEFILPFDEVLKHPAQSRFFETYNLIKNKQKKSTISAVIYGLKLLCKYNLNPAIIAACKNQKQLDSYLRCLKSDNLNKFKFFKTVYQVNPL